MAAKTLFFTIISWIIFSTPKRQSGKVMSGS
jgi:hypothetical protein